MIDDTLAKAAGVRLQRLLCELRLEPADTSRQAAVSRFLQDLDFGLIGTSEDHLRTLAELLGMLLAHEVPLHPVAVGLATALLKRRHGITSGTEPDLASAQLQALAADPLFQAVLRRSVNVDVDLELLLRGLRRRFVLDLEQGSGLAPRHLPLLTTLVEQCFNNEHVFYEDEQESRIVQALESRLLQTLLPGRLSTFAVDILVFALYRPLTQGPLSDRLAGLPMHAFAPELRDTFSRILFEPLEEVRLMAQIPSFGALDRTGSVAVRAQYEDNPYPRWFSLGTSRSLAQALKRKDPNFSWPASFPSAGLQILVPGCGTGQHPLSIAAANPGAQVLAVDLSRRSMGFALRMARKLGIRNVSFLHCDLLDLPRLGRQFHHIDCVGVLHHLEDPLAGWRALNEVLLPGGTMKVGLYGKVARMQVSIMRKEIQRLGVQAEPAAMKLFRHQMLTEPEYEHLLKRLAGLDFFYLSGFRDLLFHVIEHQYTVSEIKDILERLNFRFIGFEAHQLLRKYRELFPGDPALTSLANWRKFELHYAGSVALLTCWMARPAG